MPDTGAPWNIPYVEAADLVSDWPADSLALANAIDAGLDAAGNAGIGSNLVQTVKTDTFSTTSTSLTDVTGMSVAITPTAATSKVLVIVSLSAGVTDRGGYFVIDRAGSTLPYIGDAASSRTRGAFSLPARTGGAFGDLPQQGSIIYIDSPATTSSTTYKVRCAAGTGSFNTIYVNRTQVDTNNDNFSRTASSITVIEVGA